MISSSTTSARFTSAPTLVTSDIADTKRRQRRINRAHDTTLRIGQLNGPAEFRRQPALDEAAVEPLAAGRRHHRPALLNPLHPQPRSTLILAHLPTKHDTAGCVRQRPILDRVGC